MYVRACDIIGAGVVVETVDVIVLTRVVGASVGVVVITVVVVGVFVVTVVVLVVTILTVMVALDV